MRHTSNIIDHIEQAKESQDDKSRVKSKTLEFVDL